MKLSTKIIFGAIAAGFLTSVATGIYTAANSFTFNEIVISDANPVVIQLPPFDKVDIVTLYGENVYNLIQHNKAPYQYKGVVIEESDSVTAPEIRTSLEWSHILKPAVGDSTLTLTFDLETLADSFPKLRGKYHSHIIVGSESKKPIKLIVPRHSLKEASSDQFNLYFDKFEGGTIKAYAYHKRYFRQKKHPGWVMVNDGHIDTMILQSPAEGFRIERATVGNVIFPVSKEDACIMTKRPGDSIGKVIITAGKIHQPGNLELNTARIGTLVMPSRDTSNVALNITITRPIKIE